MTLDEWARERNYTNTELAQELGVHRTTALRLRTRQRNPSAQLAQVIWWLTKGAVTPPELVREEQ